ncbi:MAG: UDP-N-acetylmuramoyl-L-alanine--D-glutamate ligase, partial [candidate division Zixibacteria bacterium]
IQPDHLDRHGTFDAYRKLKHRIAENQRAEDSLIVNADDTGINASTIKTLATIRTFTTSKFESALVSVQDDQLSLRVENDQLSILHRSDLIIPGDHNLSNAAAAAAATSLLHIDVNTISEALREFEGVEHRLERIKPVAGVDFVNDSKATNVDSVCVAIRAIDPPIHLICGGRDKGSSYQPIIEAGKDRIKNVVAIGEAREKIFNDLGRAFSVQFATTLEEAVQKTFESAIPGETVMLSPGCASFDMFGNFEQRGLAFKAAVANLKKGKRNNETSANA